MSKTENTIAGRTSDKKQGAEHDDSTNHLSSQHAAKLAEADKSNDDDK